MTDEAKRARLMRWSALIGALLAIGCQALPPDKRALCGAVLKFATLTCGVQSP